jgi:hypothetical protein
VRDRRSGLWPHLDARLLPLRVVHSSRRGRRLHGSPLLASRGRVCVGDPRGRVDDRGQRKLSLPLASRRDGRLPSPLSYRSPSPRALKARQI